MGSQRVKALKEVSQRYGLGLVYLFGSRADAGERYLMGEAVQPARDSDLDVGVVFMDPPDGAVPIYGELYAVLSSLFEPFEVDLVFLHEVDSLFRYQVISGRLVFSVNEAFQEEFEERVLKEAADLRYKKRLFDEEVLEAIRDGYFEVKS